MCTVSVKVNEDVLRDYLPELDTIEAIERWAQQVVDEEIERLQAEGRE